MPRPRNSGRARPPAATPSILGLALTVASAGAVVHLLFFARPF